MFIDNALTKSSANKYELFNEFSEKSIYILS